MTQHTASKPGTPPHRMDKQQLPDRRLVHDVDRAEPARVLIAPAVPGVTPDQGPANLEHYEKHLDAIRRHAALAVVTNWLKAPAGRATFHTSRWNPTKSLGHKT